jgi:hypothetical protein
MAVSITQFQCSLLKLKTHSKSYLCSFSPLPSFILSWTHYDKTIICVRKTPHMAHKGGSRKVSHVQKFISRLAGWEKMAQSLLLVGLALSSIWEKARARDRQREVVGDKRQWSLICKGWDQLVKQGLGVGKGRWWEIRNNGLCSARGETSCGLGCRRGSYHSPIFCLTMMKVGAEDQELGQSICLFSCFLLAGGIVWGSILRLLWHPGWGLHSSFSGRFWRGCYPWRYKWLNFWLAVADM